MGVDRVSLLDHAGISTSANDYYNSVRCSSRRAVGGWNVHGKQDTEVDYVAVKTKYFIMSYDSGFCLLNVRSLVVYFANAPFQLF
jgi:hypothetical protein